MKVKKRKPIYLAYQWGTDDPEIVHRGICTWVAAELEPNVSGRGAQLSVWSQKHKGWQDTNVGYGDWIVACNDGKVRVMDNHTFHKKYEEDDK
jgi:hypothetical protein